MTYQKLDSDFGIVIFFEAFSDLRQVISYNIISVAEMKRKQEISYLEDPWQLGSALSFWRSHRHCTHGWVLYEV